VTYTEWIGGICERAQSWPNGCSGSFSCGADVASVGVFSISVEGTIAWDHTSVADQGAGVPLSFAMGGCVTVSLNLFSGSTGVFTLSLASMTGCVWGMFLSCWANKRMALGSVHGSGQYNIGFIHRNLAQHYRNLIARSSDPEFRANAEVVCAEDVNYRASTGQPFSLMYHSMYQHPFEYYWMCEFRRAIYVPHEIEIKQVTAFIFSVERAIGPMFGGGSVMFGGGISITMTYYWFTGNTQHHVQWTDFYGRTTWQTEETCHESRPNNLAGQLYDFTVAAKAQLCFIWCFDVASGYIYPPHQWSIFGINL